METKTVRENACRSVAIACLEEICANPDARHADRIAAAKLLLEQGGPREEQGLKVTMEGIPREYLT